MNKNIISKKNINTDINASLVIGSYLDTLGFKNTIWEFNFGNEIKSLQDGILITSEIIHNYYAIGGNNIDISKWSASDDTIMMIAVKKAIINGGSEKNYITEFLKIYPELIKSKRGSGISTLKSLKELKNYNKMIKYDKSMGGNGAAMRTAFIGLTYRKKEDLNKLIHHSIYSSRLTHNYTLGFLGGYVTALFCSYAINKIDPFNWSTLLLDTIPMVDEYMKSTDIYDNYNNDKNDFWDLWYKFNEEKLNFYKHKSNDFLFGADRFNSLIKYEPALKINLDFNKMAASGIGAVIFAYDALLMSYSFNQKKFSFESLLYFSTLHCGDNDTTGIIAGNWYGAFSGFTEFDQNKIDMLEFKNELIN